MNVSRFLLITLPTVLTLVLIQSPGSPWNWTVQGTSWSFLKSESASLSVAATIWASGSSAPGVNLSDGRDLLTSYTGPLHLQLELQENLAQPTAMVTGDFDQDGTPDLISAYVGPSGGFLTLHLGNSDAVYPNSAGAQERKSKGTFNPVPFLSPGRIFQVEASPMLLESGDFDRDGNLDLVMGAPGEPGIYLLSGDGSGGFRQEKRLGLSGQVTALVAGEFGRRDGLRDLVVATEAPDGFQLTFFDGPQGVLAEGVEALPVSGRVTGLALGKLNSDAFQDLAIAMGDVLMVAYGRHQAGAVDGHTWMPNFNRQTLPFHISAISVGYFGGKAAGGQMRDLAMLSTSGEVYFYERAGQGANVEFLMIDQLSVIDTGRQVPGLAKNIEENFRDPQETSAQPAIIPVRISARPEHDLMVVDPSHQKLHLLSGFSGDQQAAGASITTLVGAGRPVAVVPMRLNSDALDDLVVLQEGNSSGPTLVTTQAVHTFTVNSTLVLKDGNLSDDICDTGGGIFSGPLTGICTLQAAAEQADSSAGADAIEFNIGGGGSTPTAASAQFLSLVDMSQPLLMASNRSIEPIE